MVGWSPISPNWTLGHCCRFGSKVGLGFLLDGGAVFIVTADVVGVIAIGPPGIVKA